MMIPPEVSSNLTLEQIENMKQSKLNDLCDVITECCQQVSLNGVTIWSVNDEQNFMIEVENQKLVKQGKRPNIDTVYGGYYSKDMLPRYEEYVKSKSKNSNSTFNQIGKEIVQSSYTYSTDDLVSVYENEGINQDDLNRAYETINRTKADREQTQNQTKSNNFEGR